MSEISITIHFMKKLSLSFLLCCVATLAMAQALPLIGISGTHTSGGATQVNSTYIDAVMRAGGVPVVLPINTNPQIMEKMVASIDALIMTGGEDIDPLYYGEEPIPAQGEIVPARDAFDIAMIRLAVARGIPVLGICRGHQLMNVAFGGSLYQDFPSQMGKKVYKHRQQAPGWYGTHAVAIEEGSVLAKVLGKTSVRTNSFHHQAIKDLAPGFVVTAATGDGVIEGIEKQGNPKVFGVQFHPEVPTANGSDEFLPIFQYLIKLAGEKK